MKIITERQLDQWMTENCYNQHTYAIGNRTINEGCGLEKWGSLYVWYYTELGNRDNLKYFHTEQEAIEFAFETISEDRFAKSHMVGFLKDKSKEQQLIAELENRGLEYWKDEIPYGGLNDARVRVFVVGCDIRKALDLRETFNSQI